MPHRRHHPGAGVQPCDRLRNEAGRHHEADQNILVNLAGDKDIGTVADLAGVEFYDRPSMRGLQVKGASNDHPRRIEAKFAALETRGRKALIPYVTAGFRLPTSRRADARHGAAGADVIELGVPFSDPMADGP